MALSLEFSSLYATAFANWALTAVTTTLAPKLTPPLVERAAKIWVLVLLRSLRVSYQATPRFPVD